MSTLVINLQTNDTPSVIIGQAKAAVENGVSVTINNPGNWSNSNVHSLMKALKPA